VLDRRRFTTARPSCEALVPAHSEEIASLLNDPRVAATLSPNGEPPAWGARPEELAMIARDWTESGFGLWLLRDRESGAMVGRGGLQHPLATGAHTLSHNRASRRVMEKTGTSLERSFRDRHRLEQVPYRRRRW
jgi:RimJ/RimL family protein N-acetyltransferase